jgi:sRNA-binding carbon storage regulator CsrA
MTVISRKLDETILIGRNLAVTVTDVDDAGVRVHVRGELVGGAQDGERVDRAYELGSAGELRLGSLITLAIARVATNEPRVYLTVVAPASFEVFRKEVFDAMRRQP